ncbi:vanadium-dependent haloperoxidase [Mesorhizobium sp.]|jgi:hypothetical protein|uniref:vanadium-dependent haloperoxidase n=1 Tax=Mesorhizobium sp. TaxID=1871066 RepID=UPI00356B518B
MSKSNGDTNRIWHVNDESVCGLGSFHKTLPHNGFGEVDPVAFAALVSATRGDGTGFAQVPPGRPRAIAGPTGWAYAAALNNPRAGLASDRLTHPPFVYDMPPAPGVMSDTTAAEMVELYWMALLRDVGFCTYEKDLPVSTTTLKTAVSDINKAFERSLDKSHANAGENFILGVDVPGSAHNFKHFTAETLFRLGFPGDDVGPLISQFFVRPVAYGTQSIDQRQRPYVHDKNYLTEFSDWLDAQNSGCDAQGQSYGKANEDDAGRFEAFERYVATPRDLARFVNKDALHQAYFNATLILLSGGAFWPEGNPYYQIGKSGMPLGLSDLDQGELPDREAGFGVLGGPHILALVSEVATRALKVIWQQKWQSHLRLRPEAYGGLIHVQNIGVGGTKRAYGLPSWITSTDVVPLIRAANMAVNPGNADSLLLPMAFTPGSPTHPSYGAGHATVAGACVTVLKAFFLTFTTDENGDDHPVFFSTLKERSEPFDPKAQIVAYCTTLTPDPMSETCLGHERHTNRQPLAAKDAKKLTIEGELNKLAQNVAMGRSMGGVHWRSDNTRSLMLGEALAAEILAGITTDAQEKPTFAFRTFSRRVDGKPKKVLIKGGRIFVDGIEKSIPVSML